MSRSNGSSRVAAGLQSRSNNGNNTVNYPPPRLQVTVPPPTHPGLQDNGSRSPYGNGTGNSNNNNYNRSPLSSSQSSSGNGHGNGNGNHHGNGYYFNSPPSPFSGSSETLIGSSESYTKSGSIRNLKMSDPANSAHKTGHPDNDRLAPSSVDSPHAPDFWKRFSTVLHESERKDQLGEKVGGGKSSGSGGKKTQSPWLEDTNGKLKRYRVTMCVVAFLIIAAIAGGVAYHFLTKEKTDGSEEADMPTTHNFGFGDDTSTTSRKKAAKADSTTSSGYQEIINTLPAPSSLAPGITLHDNARRDGSSGNLNALAVVRQTAIPALAVFGGSAGMEKRSSRAARRHAKPSTAPLGDLD